MSGHVHTGLSWLGLERFVCVFTLLLARVTTFGPQLSRSEWLVVT